MDTWSKLTLISLAVIALVLPAYLLREALFPAAREQGPAYQYVGRSNCISCHHLEYQKFQGSPHDLAMDPALSNTVLADFNTSFTHRGEKTVFSREGTKYFAEFTDIKGNRKKYA